MRVPRIPAAVAVLAALAGTAACGGAARQDADEPAGEFAVEVREARFPVHQTVAETATLSIAVRNAGSRPVPDVAVTVETDPGDAAEPPAAFGRRASDPALADGGRPVWIVDRGPSRGTTAYANTWTLGRLAPGATTTFRWRLTAVRAGLYRLAWRVSPGLDGRARAADDAATRGSFSVTVSGDPRQVRVGRDGRFVRE